MTEAMTPRERFLATMRYEPRDRSPICDLSFWDETIDVWYEQRLPRSVHSPLRVPRHGPRYRCLTTGIVVSEGA
jgi:hypothetical protein